MWHICSLANVLGCTVQSVYPDVQNHGTNRSLLNISVRPTVAARPSVKLMWSHSSNSSKRGWGPNHFVPLVPVGNVGIQEAEWVTVKGNPKMGKQKAEMPKVATSPCKKKLLNFQSPMNQATSLPTQPSVQQGAPQGKPKGPVLHPKSKGNTATSGLQAGSPEAGTKGAVPHHHSKQDATSTELPAKESTKKKRQGAANYACTFKKDWTKEWSFVTAANDPHSFHCVICKRCQL